MNRKPMKIFIEGVGVLGPGLNGWSASQPILSGTAPYADTPIVIPPNDLLPSAERRRTGIPVKLALAVGSEAIAHSQRKADELPTVFASSSGDGNNMHHIFDMLAHNGREVSPTRFHNSVHNAPSGYWSIATRSMAPSTSLACFDWSFAAGLLEAATQSLKSGNPVALISYDAPYPQPLHATRPISATFGVALVLFVKWSERSLAGVEIAISRSSKPVTTSAHPGLETVRSGTPAARSLPLLSVLAKHSSAEIHLDYITGNQVDVTIQPC